MCSLCSCLLLLERSRLCFVLSVFGFTTSGPRKSMMDMCFPSEVTATGKGRSRPQGGLVLATEGASRRCGVKMMRIC